MITPEAGQPGSGHVKEYKMRSDKNNPASRIEGLAAATNLELEPDRVLQNRKITIALVYLTTVMSILFLLFLHIWQHEQMTRINYSISRFQKENQELKTRTNDLMIEVSMLSSLRRIEGIARGKLGMKEPDRIEYVDLQM